MTAQLERDLETFFANRVRLLGGMTTKVVPIRRGFPDRLVVIPPGRLYLVELKRADTGTVSLSQRIEHTKLHRMGVEVAVVAGKDGVVAWLRSVISDLDSDEEEMLAAR